MKTLRDSVPAVGADRFMAGDIQQAAMLVADGVLGAVGGVPQLLAGEAA